MDYNALLERGRSKLPEHILETQRFEIPKVLGHIQGNKTVISNFHQIADQLHREVDHMLKYVLKELATPGELKKNALMIGTKVPATRINEKISQYAKEFVLCSECGKPDTKLLREEKFLFLKCTACGAKKPVKVRI